ncbi:MAG: ornithine cyclodeaminase [Pseudomonadota bacterium]
MSVPFISFEVEQSLNWLDLAQALEDGHKLPRAVVEDSFLRRGPDTMLNRAAWIDGLGQAVKTCTIFPGNTEVPNINGVVTLYSDQDGTLQAILDFHLITKWKTAADSLLGALRLARPDSASILIIGAGTVANSLIDAYGAGFPRARVSVWNRSSDRVDALRLKHPEVGHAEDLETAVKTADIIATATMSTEPILQGDWLRSGQHIDMIGAFRPDMREADDQVLKRTRLFVDNIKTATEIGELRDPIARGVITEDDIVADYYDLHSGAYRRTSDDEITLFKNGGGAHLDLMTSNYIRDVARAR